MDEKRTAYALLVMVLVFNAYAQQQNRENIGNLKGLLRKRLDILPDLNKINLKIAYEYMRKFSASGMTLKKARKTNKFFDRIIQNIIDRNKVDSNIPGKSDTFI